MYKYYIRKNGQPNTIQPYWTIFDCGGRGYFQSNSMWSIGYTSGQRLHKNIMSILRKRWLLYRYSKLSNKRRGLACVGR